MSKQRNQEIGARIRAVRVTLGLPQAGFAAELSTTQANISQIETGALLPTGKFLLRFTEKCPEVDLNWLFTGTGQPLKLNRKNDNQ